MLAKDTVRLKTGGEIGPLELSATAEKEEWQEEERLSRGWNTSKK